ncbi:MAG: sigma-54-dependent Fis family transcriptional regulator [Deltaproteobacteria bacterium]|nr:sigma-54-dependent Fis family transcriptional regulator [Deltaproteobacteria bacterium]
MTKARLLIVDDEIDMLRLLERSIGTELDWEIATVQSGEEALDLLEKSPFDLALVDIRMPGMDGIELLDRIKAFDPWLTVVMMTAFGVIEIAVESIKKGAYDFLTKPFEQDDLLRILEKALERSLLLRENLNLRQRIKKEETFQNLVGITPGMQRVYDTIQMISKTDVTVLITGESGTGKNLAAKAIHDLSPRGAKPFVRVNCPTIPENILESELFGYKKGAFTHATQDKQGLFQEARGGTIFFDEIGDIAPSLQTKLLQALEDKEVKPLGQNKTVHVDVRVVASTNSDLKARIEAKEFREDLFYRLNVVNIQMPPLRERREDIPLLVDYFLEKYGAEFNLGIKRITPDLATLLMDHPWEGNVRELANTIERGIIMAPGEWIQAEDIGWNPSLTRSRPGGDQTFELPYREAKQQVMAQFNAKYFSRILQQNAGNVTRAARQCGLERQSLQQIIKKYGIDPNDFRQENR